MSTRTVAILASDFSRYNLAADPNRNTWTGGKLRVLIEALQGAEVIVTPDTRLGITYIGTKLDGLRQSLYSSSYEVLIEGTWYLAFKFGATIIPTDPEAKARAWEIQHTEERAAVMLAQIELENTPRNYGAYSAECHADWVSVIYTPAGFSPAATNTAWSTRYSLDAIRQAIADRRADEARRLA